MNPVPNATHRLAAWRGWLEAWLLESALLLLVLSAAPQLDAIAVVSGYLFSGLIPSVWGALRTPLPAGRWPRQLVLEFFFSAAFVFGLPAAVGGVLAVLGRFEEFGSYTATGSGVAGLFFLAMANLGFVLVHPARRLWNRWTDLQRRRLVFAITQAILSVTLLVALLIILGYVLLNVSEQTSFAEQPGAGPPVVLLNRLITFALPLLSAFTLSALAALLVLFPLAAWFAYRIARRTTRRLEALNRVSQALADGDYSSRVAVEGQDEVAQLQENFNRMAERLEDSRAALENERNTVARLLDSRRRLFASVSHELRTPLATIDAILQSQARSPETAGQDAAVLQADTRRLKTLIDDLFVLARTDLDRLPIERAPVDAAAVARQVQQLFSAYAWQSSGVQLVLEAPPQPLWIEADETRLVQVLGNLLRNALRFTRPGGMVGIFVASEADRTVHIQVRDTGAGIEPEDLEHIWEPFFQAESGGGSETSGLGLALVKELTERMGGSVQVESHPGEGSSFHLRFPLSPAGV